MRNEPVEVRPCTPALQFRNTPEQPSDIGRLDVRRHLRPCVPATAPRSRQEFKRLRPTRDQTCILFGAVPHRVIMRFIKSLESIMTSLNFRFTSGAALVAVLFAVSSFGCTEKTASPIKADVPLNSEPASTPSTTVLGVEPGAPTREAAATTSKAKTDVSKEQQSSAMPLPGQANDHSVLLPAASPQRSASR